MPNKEADSRHHVSLKDTKSKDNSCCGMMDLDVLVCPTCGNKITELTSLRCPRCFSSLIKPGGCSGNCAKCGSSKT